MVAPERRTSEGGCWRYSRVLRGLSADSRMPVAFAGVVPVSGAALLPLNTCIAQLVSLGD